MRFLGHDRRTVIYAALVLIIAFTSIWAQGGAAGRLSAKAVTKGAEAVYPESDHPYANAFDFTWVWQSGTPATYLDVTFDPQTSLAEGDRLYILDSHGTNIAGSPFTGASLAGTTRRVPGANLQVRLLSNAEDAAWGFKITNIEPLNIPAPDLIITKSHTGTFAVGQVGATYTIRIRNIGTAPTTGPVTVTDLLPPGLVAASIGGEGWNCIQPGGPCLQTEVLNNRGSYPPLTLTVAVAPQPNGAVINRATVSGGADSNTGNNTAEDPTDIESKGPDLRITKSHGGDFVRGQIGATYTILLANIGEGPTAGVVDVIDTPPAGLTITSMTGPGWTCAQPAGPCSRGDLLENNSTYPGITVTVNVAENAPGLVTNVAKVSTPGDVNSNNDTANDLTRILVNGPDLVIIKRHTGNFKQNQTGAAYTLEVRNIGTQPTSGNVTINEILPVGLTATSMAGIGWTCAQPAGPCTRADSLAPGASYPLITVTVNVANNAFDLINTASVAGGNDADPSNNIVTDPTIIEGDPTCTQFPESPHPYPNNFDFTWTCVVTGPPTPTSVRVDFDALTSVQNGSDFIHITDGAGNPIPGSPFTGTSLAGQSKTVPGNTVKIRLVSNASVQDWGLKVTNIVGVTGITDLTISKTHSGDFYRAHVGAQYTITVQNVGTGASSGQVTVTDTVPVGMSATNITGSGWACTQPAGPCTRSDVLANGASYPPITLTVNVASNAPAALTNIASVSGGGDTNPNNNTASDVTQIKVPVAVCTPPVPESTHPYDNDLNQLFTCVLPGNPASIDVSFDPQTLLLEGDFLFIRDKNNNNIPGSPFTGASLAGATKTVPGDTVRLNLVTDSRRTEWGFKVTNIAAVGSVDPDLTIAKTHNGNFSQGQNGATYQIVVRNNGGGPTNGQVTVTDNVPAGLVATAIGGTGWNCVQPSGPCTRNDALFSGGAYPAITLTVNVQGNAAALVTNIATVAGGGDANPGNNDAADPTTIIPAGGGGGGGGCVLPESAHPYANDFDFTWTCTIAGNPASIKVTFDALTAIDPTDQLFVMNGAGVNIGGSPFTGVILAGQTVTVPGDTVKIRLVTDGRRTDWGFKVTSVVP